MALWRDPLDELIEDLEQALPVAFEIHPTYSSYTLVGCQMLVHAILHGTPDDVARVEHEPQLRAYLAELERLRIRLDR